MLNKSLQIWFFALVLCAASVSYTTLFRSGFVKDAKGEPIKDADVRIESRDGKQVFSTVKTDPKGRYISQGLQPGVYRVTLLVSGAVRASVTKTQTKSNQPTQLNFVFKQTF